jgi:hypothetical protein
LDNIDPSFIGYGYLVDACTAEGRQSDNAAEPPVGPWLPFRRQQKGCLAPRLETYGKGSVRNGSKKFSSGNARLFRCCKPSSLAREGPRKFFAAVLSRTRRRKQQDHDDADEADAAHGQSTPTITLLALMMA